MRYIFLNNKFYSEYDKENYPEIERKSTRPYIMIQITINGLDFGIPLRSNINHNHVLWTDKANKCGADYSKAVMIPDKSYIDERNPYLRPNEHRVLVEKKADIKKGFEKYIEKYIKALSELHINKIENIYSEKHIARNQKLCNYSTLQYYNDELGISEIIKEKIIAKQQVAPTEKTSDTDI